MDDNKLRLIQQMKTALQQRPPEVSPEEWDGVEVGATPLAYNAAIDATKDQLVQQLQSKVAVGLPADNKEKLKALFDLGLYEVLKLMADPKTRDTTRFAAAQFLMEHDVGKAKQEIEHSGSLALEIRAQAKQFIAERKSGSRDVTPPESLDKTTSAVDNFLKTQMPSNFVVGKKATKDGSIKE